MRVISLSVKCMHARRLTYRSTSRLYVSNVAAVCKNNEVSNFSRDNLRLETHAANVEFSVWVMHFVCVCVCIYV